MNRFLSFLFCVLAVATCKTHQTAESTSKKPDLHLYPVSMNMK